MSLAGRFLQGFLGLAHLGNAVHPLLMVRELGRSVGARPIDMQVVDTPVNLGNAPFYRAIERGHLVNERLQCVEVYAVWNRVVMHRYTPEIPDAEAPSVAVNAYPCCARAIEVESRAAIAFCAPSRH